MPPVTICQGDATTLTVLQSVSVSDLPNNIPFSNMAGSMTVAQLPSGSATGSGAVVMATSPTIASPTVTGTLAGSAGTFTTLSASGQITSTLATGTAPLVIASTTQVANLNVSQLVGNTWAIPASIGATTPNAGAFTTLSASSTVSGTGFSTYLASPPAIGGTTAGTGKFTSVTGTSLVLNGLCTTYNSVATTGQGLPSLVGVVTTGTHTAAITATSLLAAPVAGGFYRISAYMKITAVTSAPVAGPITITYKDNDGVAQSVVMMLQNAAGSVATSTGSTTTTPVFGAIEIYCGSGTAIQYAVAFSGTGTYELVLKCEAF